MQYQEQQRSWISFSWLTNGFKNLFARSQNTYEYRPPVQVHRYEPPMEKKVFKQPQLLTVSLQRNLGFLQSAFSQTVELACSMIQEYFEDNESRNLIQSLKQLGLHFAITALKSWAKEQHPLLAKGITMVEKCINLMNKGDQLLNRLLPKIKSRSGKQIRLRIAIQQSIRHIQQSRQQLLLVSASAGQPGGAKPTICQLI